MHITQVSGELFVLIVHRSRVGGGVGTSIHQQRPDVRVFAVVVMVQQRRQPVDVVADESRPVAIARRDGADEPGHQRELAPEHVVHDEHLATVEVQCRFSRSHDLERKDLRGRHRHPRSRGLAPRLKGFSGRRLGGFSR